MKHRFKVCLTLQVDIDEDYFTGTPQEQVQIDQQAYQDDPSMLVDLITNQEDQLNVHVEYIGEVHNS